ncbi:gon-4 like protein muscle wasted isoform X2 [Brevipalpus obovatus]|uniref:gon-4 like protein muscle wasted isoform X2 n=1 Tax=Brevipalpus obovatus TaxID=246614 RepID=UPI003D9F75D6
MDHHQDMMSGDDQLPTLLDLPLMDLEDDDEYIPPVELGSEELNEGDIIARRTRSKHPIEEPPGDTLEFPDVTQDLYDAANTDMDDEWTTFLNSLYQDNIFEDVDDKEDKLHDPDYNVFEDIEKLIENDVDLSDPILTEVVPEIPAKASVLSSDELMEWSKLFTSEDLEVLYSQITQHVQLLTQQYLLTMSSQTLSSVAENSAKLLREFAELGSDKPVSLFKPSNLAGALKIVKENPVNPSMSTVVSNSWRQPPVPIVARQIFSSNPRVFPYHDLLPKCSYPDIHAESKCMKAIFTEAEDHLLAMGLHQFKTRDNSINFKLIRENLLPTKTENQLRSHLKNRKRRKKEKIQNLEEEMNPIEYYFRTGELISNRRRKFGHPETEYSNLNNLPFWLAKEIDPTFSLPQSRLPVRLKKSPSKSMSPYKNPISISSHKQTSSILKKYRYLSKLPHIKPKPNLSQSVIDGNCQTAVVSFQGIDNTIPVVFTPAPVLISSPPHTVGEDIHVEENEPLKENENSDNASHENDSPEVFTAKDQSDGKTVDEEAMENSGQNEDDDESDLAALMVASTTITSNKGRTKSHDAQSGNSGKKETKKPQNVRHRESTGLLLSENWALNDCSREQKEQVIVQLFMNKVRESLKDDEDYTRFLTYLNEFGQQRRQKNSLRDLHQKTEKLLQEANSRQVMDDFVLLLNATEARDCGKMYEYLHWRRYMNFIRKLEIYSLVEPNCISRLHKALILLKSSETTIDKQKLRSVVSKAISGHPYLMNEFSTLFRDEKPKDNLFASDGDFDQSHLLSEDTDPGQPYENILLDLTQEERKYGTNECPCNICHGSSSPIGSPVVNSTNAQDNETDRKTNQSASIRHCVACSIRFIGGKVYLQGPRKVQPAEVLYLNRENRKKPIDGESKSSPLRSNGSPKLPTSDLSSPLRNTEDDRQWSKADDKTLLEFVKERIASTNNSSMNEVFREISKKLNRSVDQVSTRFNKLIQLFKSCENSSEDQANNPSTGSP